ncbi:acyltransferase family protein [Paenibacillus sacheonensis]|uniref:Acyltransferase family protein n=1 Tax=Paenibacillus sacheonensis TaxID=742054 RepID=A0A7X5BXQ0_9BACL|nr:acyltransferase [Paenibacillus sacheonensis]MBM7566050.1 peptidoglycan/LPS O-acetylase OafA/YrhL [Paenibacillus sacheonensis]NBC68641.1 acyltransferase family protein [Paenibacillus sacheonensis]
MERNAGLDLIRSSAILLVLFCHGLGFFFMPYHDFNPLNYVTGYLGVELFFVLSGFLIGRILLQEVVERGSLARLGTFYVRRWFRTLPLYLLAVATTYLFFNRHMNPTNLFFLQNFDEGHLSFLPISWSLSIEEWFYLLIPVPLLLAGKFRHKPAAFFAISALLILFFPVLRMIEVHHNQPLWDYGVRKQIPLRLDSLVFGVLLAGVKTYHAALYRKYLAGKWALPIGVLGLAYFGGYLVYNGIAEQTMDHSWFGRTLLFSVVSLLIALLIAAAETHIPRMERLPNLRGFIGFVSAQSYGYYLFHWNLFVWFSKENTTASVAHSLYLLLFALIVLIAFTFVVHRYFEVPIMKLRDLLTKKSKRPAAHAPAARGNEPLKLD